MAKVKRKSGDQPCLLLPSPARETTRVASSRPKARSHAQPRGCATGARLHRLSRRRSSPPGIAELDARLDGGLPRGHLSEVVGPRSSGRLAIAVSALAGATARGEAVALIDPLDMFDPVSAAASGIDFQRMLWVRGEASSSARVSLSCEYGTLQKSLDRAVKALNLVLQAGGFGLVVLDLGEVAPRRMKRLPYTTWLRLHRVIEGSDTACVLIGSEPIARSAGGVTVQLAAAQPDSGSGPEAQRVDPRRRNHVRERPAMFACLYLPPPVSSSLHGSEGAGQGRTPARSTSRTSLTLVQVARDFSPRVETHGDRMVTLDISGLGSLIGDPRAIGEELRRAAADARIARAHRGGGDIDCRHSACARARGAHGGAAGRRRADARAPAASICSITSQASSPEPQRTYSAPRAPPKHLRSHGLRSDQLKRWGLRTLGDFAALPSADLSARLGQDGLRWQRWARGEECGRSCRPATKSVRGVARSRMADRRARAVVVRARAVVRAVVRSARARRSRRGHAAASR